MQERRKGISQRLAAAHEVISKRKGCSYERQEKLPSQRNCPTSGRATLIPLSKTSPWVMTQLQKGAAL